MCSTNIDQYKLQSVICSLSDQRNLIKYIHDNTKTLITAVATLNSGLSNSVSFPPNICISPSQNSSTGIEISLPSYFTLSGFINTSSFSAVQGTPVLSPTVEGATITGNGDLTTSASLIPGIDYVLTFQYNSGGASVSTDTHTVISNIFVCNSCIPYLPPTVCFLCSSSSSITNNECSTVDVNLANYVAGYSNIAGGVTSVEVTPVSGGSPTTIAVSNGTFQLNSFPLNTPFTLTFVGLTTAGLTTFSTTFTVQTTCS